MIDDPLGCRDRRVLFTGAASGSIRAPAARGTAPPLRGWRRRP
jgi:hypothetical protein